MFLNTVIALFLLLILLFYLYGFWYYLQILITKENLIKELDFLEEYKQALVEQNDNLRADLAMKVSQNEELQRVLIEVTNKQAQAPSNFLPILVTIAGVLVVIAVMLYLNSYFDREVRETEALTTEAYEALASVTIQAKESRVELKVVLEGLQLSINENLVQIGSLKAQNITQISEIMLLQNKLDAVQLQLAQLPVIQIPPEIINIV